MRSTLEAKRSATLSEIDFTPADMTEDEIQACTEELASSDGVLIAGDRYYYSEHGKPALGRTVNVAYGRLAQSR